MLLSVMESYKDLGKKLQKAIKMYSMALESIGTYPDHRAEVGVDKETLSIIGHINRFKDVKEGVKDWDSQVLLQWATNQGSKAMVSFLLERGVDIEAKDRDGRIPLWLAANQGYKAIVRLLLERGADIEAKDRVDRTPLWLAAN